MPLGEGRGARGEGQGARGRGGGEGVSRIWAGQVCAAE